MNNWKVGIFKKNILKNYLDIKAETVEVRVDTILFPLLIGPYWGRGSNFTSENMFDSKLYSFLNCGF